MTQDTSDTEDLGMKIRRLRLARGIGQERLAIDAHVDQSGLSKFERGKHARTLGDAALERIAQALNISLAELTAGTTYERSD